MLYKSIMLSGYNKGKTLNLKRFNYGLIFTDYISGDYLEIGPGNGEMLALASELGFCNLYGIDIDEEVVKDLNSRLPKCEVWHTDDTLRLLKKLDADRYSVIVLSHVFEHMDVHYRIHLLKECHRIMKKNGMVLIEVPNYFCPVTGPENFYADPTHTVPISSTGLVRTLLLAGFQDVFARHFKPPLVRGHFLSWLKFNILSTVGHFHNLVGGSALIRSPVYFAVGRKMDAV